MFPALLRTLRRFFIELVIGERFFERHKPEATPAAAKEEVSPVGRQRRMILPRASINLVAEVARLGPLAGSIKADV